MDAIVGFSVNPEITWTGIPTGIANLSGQKVSAEATVGISGTSFDVAWALKQCGHQPLLLGAVGQGDDPFNPFIERFLKQAEIDHHLLPVRERTCLASVEPEHDRHLSFKSPITTIDVSTLQAVCGAGSAAYQIVTGLMPDKHEVTLARELLNSNGGVRVLNARQALTRDKRTFSEIASHSDWLVLNRHEAADYLGIGNQELTTSALSSFLDLGPRLVIVTMDSDGSLVADKSGWREHVSAYQHGQVIDEKGAGDCLLGFFIGATLHGFSQEQALRIAMIGAGMKVTRCGTTNLPAWSEVLEVFSRA